eukprot:scaffold119256_cov18-Tisochrysis_lutea.AAC.3
MAALTHCHFVGPRGGRAKLKIAQLALKQRHWQQAWGEDGKAAYNIDWNACIYDKKGCQSRESHTGYCAYMWRLACLNFNCEGKETFKK